MENEPRPCFFGRWVHPVDEDLPKSLRGRAALVPDLLGEDIVLRRATWRDLTDAQEWVGRLDAVAARLPHRKELGEMTQRLDGRSSAELDETVASAREALTTGLRGSITPDADENLKRHQQLYFQGATAMRAGRPWDEVLLGRLSAIATGSAFDGEMSWRQSSAWLGGPNLSDAYLIAAPPGSEMRELTGEWCRWMNTAGEWPAVAKSIVGQLQLMALAPVAASAAVARLVPAFELLRSGRLRVPVLSLSNWLSQRADEVPAMVRGVFDRGEIDAWMSFVAEGVQIACARQVELIMRLDKMCDTMLRRVWRKTAIVKLVEALITHPVINVIEIADICGVSSGRATVLARQLQEHGLAKVLHPKTLESQPDDNSHGKVIVATGIVRLLGLLQPHPSDRDLGALA
jgi:hypothetical protein